MFIVCGFSKSICQTVFYQQKPSNFLRFGIALGSFAYNSISLNIGDFMRGDYIMVTIECRNKTFSNGARLIRNVISFPASLKVTDADLDESERALVAAKLEKVGLTAKQAKRMVRRLTHGAVGGLRMTLDEKFEAVSAIMDEYGVSAVLDADDGQLCRLIQKKARQRLAAILEKHH